MNRLAPEKRDRIVELQSEGKTVREIAAEVGVDRNTVSSYGPGAYRRKVLDLIEKVFVELETKGIEPTEIDALLMLHGEIGWTCHLHPEAVPDEDIDALSDCKLCVRDGLRRHHARRKAEGRPILPPWAARRQAERS